MDRNWEYCEFATVISREAMRLQAHGFRVTRTREWGQTSFHVVGTCITIGTWVPGGERTEDAAFSLCVSLLLAALSRTAEQERQECAAVEAGNRRYEAQYAYACGYYD